MTKPDSKPNNQRRRRRRRLTPSVVSSGDFRGTVLDIPGIKVQSVELRHNNYLNKYLIGKNITFRCTYCNNVSTMKLATARCYIWMGVNLCKCQRKPYSRKAGINIKHGTLYTYRGYISKEGEVIRQPCRCSLCVSNYRIYHREYYKDRIRYTRALKHLDQ